MVLGIFKIALCLNNQHVFYITITGYSKYFHYFAFETSFMEKGKLFEKKLEYDFFVESTVNERATFL